MEQETLFHLIALGDKAADTLLKLRSDLDEWFETELLSNNKYHYLVALIDEYASPNDLPRVDIDETGKLKVFVIDIIDEPRAKEWGKRTVIHLDSKRRSIRYCQRPFPNRVPRFSACPRPDFI